MLPWQRQKLWQCPGLESWLGSKQIHSFIVGCWLVWYFRMIHSLGFRDLGVWVMSNVFFFCSMTCLFWDDYLRRWFGTAYVIQTRKLVWQGRIPTMLVRIQHQEHIREWTIECRTIWFWFVGNIFRWSHFTKWPRSRLYALQAWDGSEPSRGSSCNLSWQCYWSKTYCRPWYEVDCVSCLTFV